MNAPQTDFLTGCLSKESIDGTLDKVKAECDIDKKPFSMLVLDLDHFKIYNDKYGHLDGDDILKYFASTLRISLKEFENFIFRFGGDEFFVVFPGKSGKEALSIANNLLRVLRKRPFLSRGRIYNLNFSGGIASYPGDGHESESIIDKADKAMYFSKMHGRGRVTLYKHILWKSIRRALLMVLVSLFIAGGLLYFQKSSYKDDLVSWIKGRTGRISTKLLTTTSKMATEDLDRVYLKSGRTLVGNILREDDKEVEISLTMETGSGTVTVEKPKILSIKRNSKRPS